MNQYPRLALVFAYGIRSVSIFRFMSFEDTIDCWNMPEYDLDRPFFLCLYGTLNTRREHTKKQIASVFLDYMIPTGIENKFNCRHKPHFSLQDIDDQLENLLLIGDIPIIITTSGGAKSISSGSSAVKKIEKMQAQKFIKGHPVFISDAPIRRDSILNIDAAGFTDIDLGRTIGQVHKLIYEFIQYLEELQRGNSLHMEENNTGRIRYNISYLREMKREIAYHFNEKDSNPDMLSHCQNLLAALECFKCFIEVKYNEFLEIMESITKQAAELLCEMSLDSEKVNLLKKSNEKGNMYLQNSCVDMFIAGLKEQSKIKPDSILRSGGEYHVDFDTFCELLPSVLKQNRQENLSYKQILSQCREMEEPLITPNYRNKASKTYRELYFMRNGKKVLLVPAEIYERYFPMD